jgi:hypothetical protein
MSKVIKIFFIASLFSLSAKIIAAEQINLKLDITDIMPDVLNAYRTNSGFYEALTSVKLIFKVTGYSLIEKLDDKIQNKIGGIGNVDGIKLDPVYIKYIQVEYKSSNGAPKIAPLYDETDWYIRTPDIFEILQNKPVEVIKNITVLNSEQLDKYFKNYHNRDFKYNFTVTFYVEYSSGEFSKITRDGLLLIDLYN